MSGKIDLGTPAEDDVQKIVELAFSSDFIFRSPQHQKGAHRKETTDVLALWNDVAIPIQVKSQAYNADGSPRQEDMAWTAKNLGKAASQLSGAVRTLRDGKLVELRNDRRGDVEFSTSEFRYIYGLIVLNEEARPYLAEDVVPDIGKAGVPVHVLSFDDFYNISRLLDTPGDLVGYLEMRADVLIPTLKPKVHAECEVFDYYLDHFEDLTEFRAKQRGDAIRAADMKPYGELLRSICRKTHPDLDQSYHIDKIIDHLHEVDETRPAPYGDDGSETVERNYPAIATELASIPRGRRIALGKAFRDTIQRAGEKNNDAIHFGCSRKRDDCIFFLASPLPQSERAKREQALHAYVTLLKAARKAGRVLGVATEAGFGNGRSYDCVLLEGESIELTAESEQLARNLFGDEIIVKD